MALSGMVREGVAHAPLASATVPPASSVARQNPAIVHETAVSRYGAPVQLRQPLDQPASFRWESDAASAETSAGEPALTSRGPIGHATLNGPAPPRGPGGTLVGRTEDHPRPESI